MLVQTINPDIRIAHFCDYCGKDIYTHEVLKLAFCSFNCKRRFVSNDEKWNRIIEKQKLSNEQQTQRLNETKSSFNPLAHWLKSKKVGSKAGQFLAHFSGSSSSIVEDEPMSHDPKTNFELEPRTRESAKTDEPRLNELLEDKKDVL